MGKISWGDIPSLDNITVDWDYEPESPLGKRSWVRIGKNDLHMLLNVRNIQVKIVSRQFDEAGNLLDISPNGLAVILHDTRLAEGVLIKIGFFLGKQKVLTRAVVRNIGSYENNKHRVGIEFVEPEQEAASFISGLIASNAYNS
ncbi:MAG: PilZ domain-containing protein [Desulforhopalus sp.]